MVRSDSRREEGRWRDFGRMVLSEGIAGVAAFGASGGSGASKLRGARLALYLEDFSIA